MQHPTERAAGDYFRIASFILALWISCRGAAAQIAKHPSTQTVPAGETAVFNCSLSCYGGPTPVTWYITTPDTGRNIAISQYTSLSQIKSIHGLDLARGSVDECSVGGYRVEQLVMNRASRQLHMAPVQCATLCFDTCPCSGAQVYFSKHAVLLVSEPSTTVATSDQSSGGRSSTPNVTPTQCPVQANSVSAASLSPISVFPTSAATTA
ncbi:hypothetical protein EMCRGX_G022524 [Ephydatia muelleri]|eukprot:Em0009g1263a